MDRKSSKINDIDGILSQDLTQMRVFGTGNYAKQYKATIKNSNVARGEVCLHGHWVVLVSRRNWRILGLWKLGSYKHQFLFLIICLVFKFKRVWLRIWEGRRKKEGKREKRQGKWMII